MHILCRYYCIFETYNFYYYFKLQRRVRHDYNYLKTSQQYGMEESVTTRFQVRSCVSTAGSTFAMLLQEIGHQTAHPVRMVQMHVVVAADHCHGHVRSLAVKLVGVFQVRGITGGVLVGQHEDHGARDVAQDPLLLAERHQGVEFQLQALVAGERVPVVADFDQPSTGEDARRLVRQLGRPAGHHFADRLVERVHRRHASALPPVQRLHAVDPLPDRGRRAVHVHGPRAHGVQHYQAPDAFRVHAGEPRAQLPAETVSQVDELGPAEVVGHPLDRAHIVDEL